jgi:uncharacterized membrane protein
MKRLIGTIMTVGVIFLILVVCLSFIAVGEGRAQDTSFTYTATVTQKGVCIGDTTHFSSILTNTGAVSDTYNLVMIEKPPTPDDWWMRFCTETVCAESTDTDGVIRLEASESEEITLDILPRSAGTGRVTFRITSRANPSLTDSITFTLYASEECPVTNQWGLYVLILLISISGLFLILRRLKPAKAT